MLLVGKFCSPGTGAPLEIAGNNSQVVDFIDSRWRVFIHQFSCPKRRSDVFPFEYNPLPSTRVLQIRCFDTIRIYTCRLIAVRGSRPRQPSAAGPARSKCKLAQANKARPTNLCCYHLLMPKTDASLPVSSDATTAISAKIRTRLLAAKKRFHSNDNIAEFIEPGELDLLLDEVQLKMQGVLDSLVIDTVSDHNTGDTARRVAKMYINEVFNGRYVGQPKITEFPNVERLNELMIVGPITVRSACSHHFCPVIGRVWIGVLPNEHTNVIGLSKYARLAEWVMGRPQIQEEAVVQLADLIQERTQPDGLAIVMEANHYCMAWRGVKDMDNRMINSVMRGSFLKNPSLRLEFLSLIPRKG